MLAALKGVANGGLEDKLDIYLQCGLEMRVTVELLSLIEDALRCISTLRRPSIRKNAGFLVNA